MDSGYGMGGSPNTPLSYTELWRASPMGYGKPSSSPPQPAAADPAPVGSSPPSSAASTTRPSSFTPAGPVDYLNSGSFPPPVPPLDLDPLAGVFSFSPCGPTYK